MFAIRNRLINTDILRIHAEDAAFALSQRPLACDAPNYRLVDLYDLEQRLQGHLDALALAGDAGLDVALDAAETNLDGDSTAVLLHVGLRLGRKDAIDKALGMVPKNDHEVLFGRRLAEAASWCSNEQLSSVMLDWLRGGPATVRWIAIEVCGIRRVDPRHHLQGLLVDPDPLVRSRAARLAGELGRHDLLRSVVEVGGDEGDLAAIFLGDTGRAVRLGDVDRFPKDARTARRFAETLPVALRREAAVEAIKSLLALASTRRWGIVAIGALGWSDALPSLLRFMNDPLSARVAVSAFEQITGLYVAHENLELEDFPDDPDNPLLDAVEAFAETNTPWPDPERFQQWHERNGARYSGEERLLLGAAAWTFSGRPDADVKYQARYRWIAITQALRRPEAPLPNWASRVHLEGRVFTRTW